MRTTGHLAEVVGAGVNGDCEACGLAGEEVDAALEDRLREDASQCGTGGRGAPSIRRETLTAKRGFGCPAICASTLSVERGSLGQRRWLITTMNSCPFMVR